jgi:hypothetical protein
MRFELYLRCVPLEIREDASITVWVSKRQRGGVSLIPIRIYIRRLVRPLTKAKDLRELLDDPAWSAHFEGCPGIRACRALRVVDDERSL